MSEILLTQDAEGVWDEYVPYATIVIDTEEDFKRMQEAVEKQIPKKPTGTYTDFRCSVCGRRVRSGKGSSSRRRDNFCQRCGQKLDWSE